MKSLSPLRYPGGKSRLYEQIQPLIDLNKTKSYAEPFSGGFGLGLLLLFNNKVDKVFINDLDKNIYSFWRCIKNDPHHLVDEIKRVSKFENSDQWLVERKIQMDILKSNTNDYKSKAFATLFLNRVNYSGILKGGPIGGAEQNGKYLINCRFDSTQIIEKIQKIALYKDKIKVTNLPYQRFLKILDSSTFVFLDPPYVVNGKSLYMNNFENKDHLLIEKRLRTIENPWVMTYDDVKLIRDIYSDVSKYKITNLFINHYAGAFKVGKELFISPICQYNIQSD